MFSKTVVCDCRIYPESVQTLKNLGYNVILLPRSKYLAEPVSAHPDMSLIKIEKNIIVASDVYDLFTNVDDCIIYNREDVLSDNFPLKYPLDVALNCAIVGNNIICNKLFTSELVLKIASENDYNLIDVKQGYAKCSIVIVSDNSIITEDRKIALACLDNGIDVLLLSEKISLLDGYDNGFIGGCSGKLSCGKIVFNGDITKHPEFDKIDLFCKTHNSDVLSLCNKPLYDVGSILEL